MTSVESSYSSSSRITGMFSNLDTDTLVKNMCSNQQSKIDKQEQNVTTYNWYIDALDDVLDATEEFSNTYYSALSDSSMLKTSTYYSYDITSDSTDNAVSLSASGSALLGDYAVKVTQLAENANISSSGKVSADGVEISSSNTATLDQLSLANPLQFDVAGNISFSINGSKFSFSQDTTLQSMVNTINSDEDANVTMKYSRLTDTFTITADSGGEDSSVIIKNLTGNAFGDESAFMIDERTVRNGCDAICEINGTAVTRDSNEFSIDGITFDLNKVTAGTENEVTNFRVERDYSSTVSAISSFVDGFNTFISKLDSLVSAKDISDDYPPLTDAQKEEMSEEQITTWEKKAKQGILHNDPDLEKLISNLKSAFFSPAGGTGKASTAIGISGGSYYGSDKGRLTLDTDALNAALESSPDTVVSMFTGGDSNSSSSKMGIIYKIKSALTTYEGNADDAIDDTELKIDDKESDIDDLEDRLDSLAESYYEKFSAMETALATLNSQASYISQIFSS
ncbi:MAG: flagellar filament capping protein FliD [Oscillospiraceae bacterium]